MSPFAGRFQTGWQPLTMGNMAELSNDDNLLQQATQGDREALGRLLFARRQRLLRHIGRKLPAVVRSYE